MDPPIENPNGDWHRHNSFRVPAADDVVWGRALAALDSRPDAQTLSPKVYINHSDRVRTAWAESSSRFPSAKSGGCCEGPLLNHFHLHGRPQSTLIPRSTYLLLTSAIRTHHGVSWPGRC